MPPFTDRAESYPGESDKVQELCWHDVDVGFEDPASRNQRILVPHHKAGIRLAHMTAQERGAPTIMDKTVEQAVKDDEGICPASFEVGRGLDRAHFYAWMDTGRESDILYAQLQGWISYEKVQAESNKRNSRLMVKLQHQLHTYIDKCELFFAPPLGLLWELIADLEDDVADAIEPVASGADTFQVSTTCDARRAVRDFETLEDPLPAHRFDALAFPTTIPMSFKHDHDGVATKSVAYRTGRAAILSSGARQMMEFIPPWPVTYLFLSPSVAAALLLSGARRHKLRLPDEYWQALAYYVEVQSVSFGKTWGGAVLLHRPPSAHSPAPSTKVRKSAERLQGFESHTRKFCRPSDELDGGKGKAKRGPSGSSPSKKQGGSTSASAGAVGGSSSASSGGNISGSSTIKGKGKGRQTYHWQQGSVDELKQALDAAITVYDTSRSRFLNSLAQEFVCCGGRLPVFLLYNGLAGIFNALSEARAQELQAVLETKRRFVAGRPWYRSNDTAKRHDFTTIELAIDIAADRGASTIRGPTAQQYLDEGQDIDPLTLAGGDEVEQAHFLPASAKDCHAALHHNKMDKDEVAFLPTYDQLLLPITEVESLAAGNQTSTFAPLGAILDEEWEHLLTVFAVVASAECETDFAIPYDEVHCPPPIPIVLARLGTCIAHGGARFGLERINATLVRLPLPGSEDASARSGTVNDSALIIVAAAKVVSFCLTLCK